MKKGAATGTSCRLLRGVDRASCATKNDDIDGLRAEVNIGVAYHRDGGFGDFVIVDRITGTRVFAASGWKP